MSTDVRSVDERSVDDCEVLATVDEAGGHSRFVVADIATDDAWVSVPDGEACALAEWR